MGYVDPDNSATDIQAGARHGNPLLFVVALASVAAAFVQVLVVRLTLATGRDLATLFGERFPRPVAVGLWIVSEVALIATDLAELLGMGLALELLLGIALPFMLVPMVIMRATIGSCAACRSRAGSSASPPR